MTGGARTRRQLAAELAVAGLAAAFLAVFVVTQWGRLPDHDWRFSLGWLALAAAALGAFYAGTCEIWRAILRSLGERIERRPGQAVYAKSLLARYVPTSVLMLVGRVMLAQRQGVARKACLASMVHELGCQGAAAVILGSYFVITLPPLEDVPARYAVLGVVPFVLAALHPRVFQPVANRALRIAKREPLESSLPFSRVLLFTGAHVVTWTLMGLGLFAFAAALHPVGVEHLPYVAASYSVGFCVAVVSFVAPAGLGTRDATVAAALGVVLAANVAIAIAVAFRIIQTGMELLYAAATTALARGTRIAIPAAPEGGTLAYDRQPTRR